VGGKWGFVNEKGEEVIPPRFDEVWGFATNGLAAVKVGETWGFINEKGEEVIQPCFDEVRGFAANGLTIGSIFSPRFCAHGFAAKSLAMVKVDKKWGFINEKGEEVIPPRFDDVLQCFNDGGLMVKIGGKWGFINDTGEEVIPPRFDDMKPSEDGRLVAVKAGKKWGIINNTGEEVIPPCFADIGCEFSFPFDIPNGLVAARVGKKWGYIRVFETPGSSDLPAESATAETPAIRMDVWEREDAYEIHAELPGIGKKNIQVTVEGKLVSISAEIRQRRETKEGERLLRAERHFGKISRSLQLPQEIDDTQATTRLKDGILEIIFPKRAAAHATL
jgi:HSP20 family molecular chaperone IbpA